jgi:C-terminal processing protease CtpA/Prc
MKKLPALLCVFLVLSSSAQTITSAQYREDFDFFWSTVRDNYCYWDKKHTDWNRVKEMYAPTIDTVTSRKSFVLLLEKVYYELYDHHGSLSTNTQESQRLVPTGADIWAEFINGKPIIVEVKNESGAAKAGLKAGMQLVAFNGIKIDNAIVPFLAKTLKQDDTEARNYALRVLLAGKHSDNDRRITVWTDNTQRDYFPDRPVNLLEHSAYENEIESRIIAGTIGYIRINNRLGDNGVIAIFDSVLHSFKNTKALILDLRETPSGGNTIVARAIMGSFIKKEGFYQKHELPAEEHEAGIKRSWVEIVSPRKDAYTKPLVVLVDHWTGSVAEGITIGFDALKRATIVGTRMAELNGAIYSFSMPNSGIGFSIPVEKLFHINGKPRENFVPPIFVDVRKQKQNEDLVLKTAVQFLKTR